MSNTVQIAAMTAEAERLGKLLVKCGNCGGRLKWQFDIDAMSYGKILTIVPCLCLSEVTND